MRRLSELLAEDEIVREAEARSIAAAMSRCACCTPEEPCPYHAKRLTGLVSPAPKGYGGGDRALDRTTVDRENKRAERKRASA